MVTVTKPRRVASKRAGDMKMKAGAIFVAALLFGTVYAQDEQSLYTTSYTTDNGTTVVAFITENRNDFYELLDRMGKTDKWEYSVGWRPHFRLSVYVSSDEKGDDALGSVLSSLHMKMDGHKASLFVGNRLGVDMPQSKAYSDNFSLSIKNVPSLSIVAMIAEGLKKEYRVTKAKSRNVTSLNLEKIDEKSFLKLFGKVAKLDIKSGKKLWHIKAKLQI